MSSTVVASNPCSLNSSIATRSSSSRDVAGGRGIPSLWTVVAPCANMRVMTTTAAEADIEIPVEDIDEVLAEVLVEEISIDGMCGVY